MRKSFRHLLIVSIALLPFLMVGASVQARPEITKSPVSIDADSLELLQQERRATFEGNVVVVQGEMTMKSDKMTVLYGEEKEGQESALGALQRIEAEGSVKLMTPGETAQGKRAIYDAEHEKIFMFGDIVLRRGGNVLNGSALEYSVTTGSSVLSGGVTRNVPKSTSRVRGVFVPNTLSQ